MRKEVRVDENPAFDAALDVADRLRLHLERPGHRGPRLQSLAERFEDAPQLVIDAPIGWIQSTDPLRQPCMFSATRGTS